MNRPRCEIRFVQRPRHQRHRRHSPPLDALLLRLDILMLYDNMEQLTKLHEFIFSLLA